jgi:Fibrinogen beta and gamma chains, C-terminal globular domain
MRVRVILQWLTRYCSFLKLIPAFSVQNVTKSVAIPTKLFPMAFRSVNNWIVIHSRVDSSYPVRLGWTDYVNGFGNSSSGENFWLGLDDMNLLTSSNVLTYRLRIELQAAANAK